VHTVGKGKGKKRGAEGKWTVSQQTTQTLKKKITVGKGKKRSRKRDTRTTGVKGKT